MRKRSSPDRVSSSVRRGRNQKRRFLLSRLRKVLGLVSVFFVILTVGVYRSQLGEKAIETFSTVTSSLGFVLDSVLISGASRVTKADILNATQLQHGTNIFYIDQLALTNKILQLSWVSSVYVRRRLPSTIELIVQEHEPLALWHNEGKVYLISKRGEIISDVDIKQFRHLPSVVGKKAMERARHLLSVLSDYKDLYLRFKYAIFVGERRWDLIFENGVVAKLPADKFEDSINYLKSLQENRKILDRNVEIVDLRFDNKLILRKPQNVKLPGYHQSQGV